MNPSIRTPLMCLAAMALSGSALADAAAPCGIATNVLANGTVELSNTGTAVKCEPPAGTPSAPANAAAVSAPTKVAPSANEAAPDSSATPVADAQAAQADTSKDPREVYKDAMIQGAGTPAENPALSRRYKMMDKATYQATVLSGPNSGAPADAPANAAPAQ